MKFAEDLQTPLQGTRNKMKGLSPDFTQSHCPRIWQNAFYVRYWKDFWKYVEMTRQIDEWMTLYDKPLPSLVLYEGTKV